MSLALIFWVIVIVALVFGIWGGRDPRFAPYLGWPTFVLIVILGLAVFGFHVAR